MYPILFEFGVITVFSLWFFIAIGFIVGSLVFIRLSKRYRVRLTLLSENSIVLFFWTLFVSRLLFILLHTELYFYRFQLKNILKIFAIWDKGLSFWGAVFAWFLGIWYLSRHRENTKPSSALRLWDITFPALFAGMVFGNIGAFLDGINYGIPTSLPWGMTFRNANVKYISEIHPTQLYAAIYSLGIALLLLALLKRLRGDLVGFATEIGIFCFSFFKFLEDFLRGDEAVEILFLRLPQLLAFIAMIVSGYLIFERYHNRTGNDPGHILKNFVTRIFTTRRKQNSSTMSVKPPENLRSQTT